MFTSPFASPFASPFPQAPTRAQQPRANPELPRELSLPRYVNYLADYSGCGHWRILWPEQIINATGKGCSSSLTSMVFDPRWYEGVKCVNVQRQASSAQKQFIGFLKEIQKQDSSSGYFAQFGKCHTSQLYAQKSCNWNSFTPFADRIKQEKEFKVFVTCFLVSFTYLI